MIVFCTYSRRRGDNAAGRAHHRHGDQRRGPSGGRELGRPCICEYERQEREEAGQRDGVEDRGKVVDRRVVGAILASPVEPVRPQHSDAGDHEGRRIAHLDKRTVHPALRKGKSESEGDRITEDEQAPDEPTATAGTVGRGAAFDDSQRLAVDGRQPLPRQKSFL